MAVVPYYFLVWYNQNPIYPVQYIAVVPYYFLVWYNLSNFILQGAKAVVPYYFLVWYNYSLKKIDEFNGCSSLLFLGMV